VAAGDLAGASEVVRHAMESAYPLSVPLQADLGSGETWADAAPAGH
jgi:DNA polymerase I-like protein with 3'-5' exonuclease and polymerase domains